jgi:hypothetical protein
MMDLATLKKAVDKLLTDGVEGEEPVCVQTPFGQYALNGITVVVESDDWVPGTVVATTEEIEDS